MIKQTNLIELVSSCDKETEDNNEPENDDSNDFFSDEIQTHFFCFQEIIKTDFLQIYKESFINGAISDITTPPPRS